MAPDEQLIILFVSQAKGLLEIETPHLLIRDVFAEKIGSKACESPSGLAQAVVKINIEFHKRSTSRCFYYDQPLTEAGSFRPCQWSVINIS